VFFVIQPDHAQPPGAMMSDAVPFSQSSTISPEQKQRRAGPFKYERRPRLRRSISSPSRAGIQVLRGGGLPSGIFPAKLAQPYCAPSQAESRKFRKHFLEKLKK